MFIGGARKRGKRRKQQTKKSTLSRQSNGTRRAHESKRYLTQVVRKGKRRAGKLAGGKKSKIGIRIKRKGSRKERRSF